MANKTISIDLLIQTAKSVKSTEAQKSVLLDIYEALKRVEKGSTAFDQLTAASNELTKSLGGVNASFEDIYGDLKPLSSRLGEMEDRMYELALAGQQSTQEFKDLQAEAIKMRSTIIDVDASVDAFAQKGARLQGFIGVLTGVAGGFAVIQGTMALLGSENEDLEKGLLKVQAALAILNGLSEINRLITEKNIVVQGILNVVMRANPIMLLVTGLTLAAGALAYFTKVSGTGAVAEKRRNAEKEKAVKLAKAQAEAEKKATEYLAKESSGYLVLIERLKQTNAGSTERKKLIDDINKQYGTTLQNLKDEKTFQDQLNQSVEDYMAFKIAEYNLLQNEEKIQLNLKTQENLKASILKQEKELLLVTAKRNAALLNAPKDFDLNLLPQVKAYNDLTDSIEKNKKELSDAELRFRSYATVVTKTTEEMGKLGFKTTETLAGTVKDAQKATDNLLKMQENLLKAKSDLSEQEKKQLEEIEDLRISLMEDGYAKDLEMAELNRRRKIELIDKENVATVKALAAAQKAVEDAAIKAGTPLTEEEKTKQREALAEQVRELAATRKELGLKYDAEYQAALEKARNAWTDRRSETIKKTQAEDLKENYDGELQLMNDNLANKLISEETYNEQYEALQKARADIQKYWTEKELGTSEPYRIHTLKHLRQAAEKEQLKSLREQLKNENITIEEYNKKKLKLEEGFELVLEKGDKSQYKVEYDNTKSYLENLVELYKKAYGEIPQIVHDSNVERFDEELKEKEKLNEQLLTLEQQLRDATLSIYNNSIDMRLKANDRLYEDTIAKIDAEEAAYNEQFVNRTALEQAKYDTQLAFDNKRANAERKRQLEEDRLNKKRFIAQKANDSATAGINTAVAVTKTVAELGGVGAITPPGAALIAAVIAGGLVQQASILSQEYIPAYAKGGLVTGPGTGTSDSINAKLSNGEVVINAKSASAFAPLLDAINQAGGGVAIPYTKKPKTQSMNKSDKYDFTRLEEAIYTMSDRPIETFVTEKSITQAQLRAKKLNDRTTF
jgi:hypothetical protein